MYHKLYLINGRMKGIDSKGNVIRDFGSTASGLSIAEQMKLIEGGMTLSKVGQVVQ